MVKVEPPELLACCASPRWAAAMSDRGPFADADALGEASDAALAELPWEDVLAAVSAHPRIGERPAGEDREADWSRSEQSGVAPDDELVQGNEAYEERFGHVFLICATGLGTPDVVAALRRRLTNDPITEQAVVREELRRIVRLRLGKLAG